MTRKKVESTSRLTRKITIRVSVPFYDALQKRLPNTSCRTLAELARCMVTKEKITFFHKDASLESTALELAAIRKELNMIGRNINQITHVFHITDKPNQKMFHALKVAEQYRKVGAKVDQLLVMVSDIAKTWLQK